MVHNTRRLSRATTRRPEYAGMAPSRQ
eukprot:ctg_7194.g673